MYDMVTGGRRQVGSTIKPFLYSLAMENGFTPCSMAPNVQQSYRVGNQTWTPRNANRKRYGETRFIAAGLIGVRLFVLTFTLRGNAVRIISLRKANRREVQRYARQA